MPVEPSQQQIDLLIKHTIICKTSYIFLPYQEVDLLIKHTIICKTSCMFLPSQQVDLLIKHTIICKTSVFLFRPNKSIYWWSTPLFVKPLVFFFRPNKSNYWSSTALFVKNLVCFFRPGNAPKGAVRGTTRNEKKGRRAPEWIANFLGMLFIPRVSSAVRSEKQPAKVRRHDEVCLSEGPFFLEEGCVQRLIPPVDGLL